MNLETLYKRSKTGAIQYYTVIVERGFSDEDPATIIKESGKLGTDSPLIHREVIKEGKNLGRKSATTTLSQARSQAKSDWTKKKDSGYKSLADLGIQERKVNDTVSAYAIKVDDNEKITYLDKALESALPQFNTDASGNVMPMLAKEAKKNLSNITLPCYGQPKLDGVRCLMVVTVEDIGKDCNVKFLSRTGKEYTTLSHIAEVVAIAALKNEMHSFILDGEIYCHDIEFEEIIEAVKKSNVNTPNLVFMVYDIINDKPQNLRSLKVLDTVDIINSPALKYVPTRTVTCPEDANKLHDQFIEEGYEGLMLRNYKGLYGQGQRSSDLLKYKVFQDAEFEFDRFVLGQRGIMDMKAICKTKEGKEFGAKMKGSLEHKTKLYNAGHKTGEKLTVKYFNMTKYDIPRFPVGLAFRDYE